MNSLFTNEDFLTNNVSPLKRYKFFYTTPEEFHLPSSWEGAKVLFHVAQCEHLHVSQ